MPSAPPWCATREPRQPTADRRHLAAALLVGAGLNLLIRGAEVVEAADRWYRFGRTILYGQLEDETPVGSVRRLATYSSSPVHAPVSIQRWSTQRLLLTAAAALGALLLTGLFVDSLQAGLG
jgi:hypothetical protein